jgi:hypothetical protein
MRRTEFDKTSYVKRVQSIVGLRRATATTPLHLVSV